MTATATDMRGHNEPPAEVDNITARLTEEHADLLKRRDALLDAVDRVPETIDDEAQANKVADFIKQLQACVKNADAIRVDEKEPYLDGGRRVDGFFKGGIVEPISAAKKKVEARLTAYQRKVAEAERKRREEAERKAREEAERARKEAEERAAALREEEDLEAALAAEEAAKKAAEAAAQAEREANAKAADYSRSRSEHGSVASLRTVWTFADLDRAALDLEALRDHLPAAALDSAVRSFIKAGGRQLRGVRIYEDYSTVVR